MYVNSSLEEKSSSKYGSSLTLVLYTLAALLAAEARFSAVNEFSRSMRSNLLTAFGKTFGLNNLFYLNGCLSLEFGSKLHVLTHSTFKCDVIQKFKKK